MVMPVIFTRDSGRLARDEFLVIFKGPRTSIHVHICNCVIVGHCIALRYVVYVGYFQSCINYSQF